MKKLSLIVAALLLLAAPLYLLKHERHRAEPEPVEILTSYLKASYARDFKQAYRWISAKDKQLKSPQVFSRERGAFRGFALVIARNLAEFIEVQTAKVQSEGARARVKVALKLPDANSLGSLLMDWDEDRLNSLSAAEQRKLLAALNQLRRSGTMKMIEGEEEFVLVKEGRAWKLFLNLAEGVRISFSSVVPAGGVLAANPVTPETVARANEPFSVTYRVKNLSEKVIAARILHKVAPQELREHLDIVECALLLPVQLQPGKETEFSTTYLLRRDLPEGTRQIGITYEFKVEP